MFKRLLVVTASACLCAAALLLAAHLLGGGAILPLGEAPRRAGQYEQVLRLIHEHYVRETDTSYEALSNTALEGLLRSLDPHSEYMVPREFENFRADTSQEFGGIGVQIEMRDRRLTVVAPISGTPGERAGLLRGDQFIKVDGRAVEGLSLDECLTLLRGKPGSDVALTVARPASGETLEKTVRREVIRVESVRDVRMLSSQVGYVRVLQFAERTGAEFERALASLEGQGMRALVLDLRDNPGGLLTAAVEVAQPFFDAGELVVYTQGRTPQSREDIKADGRGPRRMYPVAVLINASSASASEIVAGALRDTGRAVLVGEKSFGKGSVQTIFSIRGGPAVRLTTALYYTPTGDIINGKGLEPHIPVTLTVEEERRLAVQRNRLPLMSAGEFREQFQFDPIEDRQLSAAHDALRGALALAGLSQPAGT